MEDITFALNGICFTFPSCNLVSTSARSYLCERLHETRTYSLKEHEIVFLKRHNLIFSKVAGNI